MNSPVSPAPARDDGKCPDPASQARDKRASVRLRKLARLRTAISITNRSIIRSHSPAEVYRAVCRACTTQTDVKLAWIGIADEAVGRIVPVEVDGPAAAYLADTAVSLASDDAAGLEPAAIGYREHRAYFCNFLERDVPSETWRQRAAANGLRAVVALPLLRGGKPYGMLAAYGSERNFFDADSVEMLLDMADNISFAIDQFDRVEERRLHIERFEDLSRRLVAVQENERRVLARELHDRANPNLAAIKLILASVEGTLPIAALEGVRAMLMDILGLVDDTAAGIREICANLRPTLLDYTGLVPTLESYAEMFTRRTGVPVHLRVPNGWARLELEVECMLFRIAQEALTNCAKHACARNIEIELTQSEHRRTLVIRDDGFGFEPEALGSAGNAPGHGLLSMRERAEFGGARFSLSSHPLNGTEVRVELDASAEVRIESPQWQACAADYRKPCSQIT